MNCSCNHDFVFVNEWTFRAIMTFLLFCFINKWTVCAIMTFCFVKEWTFREIMTVFLSHNERFLLSWFVFVCFCKWKNCSCHHAFFCCFVVVKQLPFRAIMILFCVVLSMNELFVLSWHLFLFCRRMNVLSCRDFVVVKEWTFRAIMILFCFRFGQWMNSSCYHDCFVMFTNSELFAQSWFCFCQWMNLSYNHDFCFWSIMTFRAIMTFVFVKEWTFRTLRTLFVFWSMNELFVQSWFAFFCVWSMDELVVQSWPLFFGQWMNFSYSHDFFCVCQWKNFSRNQYYCFVLSNNELLVQSWHFCLVNEWTFRAIMTLLLLLLLFLCWWRTDLSVQSLPLFGLSMNELFVQSWLCFLLLFFVNEWTFRAIMTLVCQMINFPCNHDIFTLCFLVNEWTFRAIMISLFCLLFGQCMNSLCNHDFCFVKEWHFCAIMFFVVFVSCLSGLRPGGPKAWGPKAWGA